MFKVSCSLRLVSVQGNFCLRLIHILVYFLCVVSLRLRLVSVFG